MDSLSNNSFPDKNNCIALHSRPRRPPFPSSLLLNRLTTERTQNFCDLVPCRVHHLERGSCAWMDKEDVSMRFTNGGESYPERRQNKGHVLEGEGVHKFKISANVLYMGVPSELTVKSHPAELFVSFQRGCGFCLLESVTHTPQGGRFVVLNLHQVLTGLY